MKISRDHVRELLALAMGGAPDVMIWAAIYLLASEALQNKQEGQPDVF